jgi:hypothetical protein
LPFDLANFNGDYHRKHNGRINRDHNSHNDGGVYRNNYAHHHCHVDSIDYDVFNCHIYCVLPTQLHSNDRHIDRDNNCDDHRYDKRRSYCN